MRKSRTIAISTLILISGSIVSKLLGFLRESVLAYFFGATKVTDAYIIALSIPAFILLGIGGAISTSIIPIASKVEKEEGQPGLFRLISNLTNTAILVSVALVALSIVVIDPIIGAFAQGFDKEATILATKLTLIMLPTSVFMLAQAVLNSLLQYRGDFFVNALTGALQNSITILLVVLTGRSIGISSAAIGTLASSASITLLQLLRLRGIGYRHKWIINVRDDGFKAVIGMLAPIMAAGLISQLGVVVIRSIGTGLGEGSVAFINYAQKLVLMPYAIIGTSIITVFYPTISKQFQASGTSGLLGSLHKSMSTLYFALAPIAAGAVFLATEVVKVVYERGAFTSEMTTATSIVLVYLAVSMPFMGLADLFSKALFVMQDTVTPLIVTAASSIFGVALAWLLSPSLSFIGLAIGMSGQYLASLLLSSYLFNRKLVKSRTASQKGTKEGIEHPIVAFNKRLLVSIAKTTASTAVMILALVASKRLIGNRLPTEGLLKTLISITIYAAIGGISYVLAAALLKTDELTFLFGIAKGFLLKLRNKLAPSSKV